MFSFPLVLPRQIFSSCWVFLACFPPGFQFETCLLNCVGGRMVSSRCGMWGCKSAIFLVCYGLLYFIYLVFCIILCFVRWRVGVSWRQETDYHNDWHLPVACQTVDHWRLTASCWVELVISTDWSALRSLVTPMQWIGWATLTIYYKNLLNKAHTHTL